MPFHVVFLQSKPLEAIRAGRKCHEIRISEKRLPFMRAATEDRALLKRSCGEIELECVFGAIDRFECAEELRAFQKRWRKHALSDCILSKPRARYGVAIELLDVREISVPEHLTPRGVRIGWVADWELL
jgi:hypothetical protein